MMHRQMRRQKSQSKQVPESCRSTDGKLRLPETPARAQLRVNICFSLTPIRESIRPTLPKRWLCSRRVALAAARAESWMDSSHCGAAFCYTRSAPFILASISEQARFFLLHDAISRRQAFSVSNTLPEKKFILA